MSEPRPSVVILAGPNGAGKSTVAPALLRGALAVNEFVNADVIASGLSAFNPEGAVATRLESQPIKVYDEGVWSMAKAQAAL